MQVDVTSGIFLVTNINIRTRLTDNSFAVFWYVWHILKRALLVGFVAGVESKVS